MSSNQTMLWLATAVVIMVAVVGAFWPMRQRIQHGTYWPMPLAAAVASGIFLAVALIHMLNNASQGFSHLGYDYPWAPLLAGGVFVLFLGLEHLSHHLNSEKSTSNTFAVVAFIMLSIHSFLAGLALGLSDSAALSVMIFVAIIAHKWSAALALSLQITRSNLSLVAGILLLVIFSLMTPAGMWISHWALTDSRILSRNELIQPIFFALASGTFLYLGTLHGLANATMIQKDCGCRQFFAFVAGFIVMALVAVWL